MVVNLKMLNLKNIVTSMELTMNFLPLNKMELLKQKNRVLQEMATIMLQGKNLPRNLWAEAVSTTCYIINRVYFRTSMDKTSYELWHEKKPNISYFKFFL